MAKTRTRNPQDDWVGARKQLTAKVRALQQQVKDHEERLTNCGQHIGGIFGRLSRLERQHGEPLRVGPSHEELHRGKPKRITKAEFQKLVARLWKLNKTQR